jgi:hypothetical protein
LFKDDARSAAETQGVGAGRLWGISQITPRARRWSDIISGREIGTQQFPLRRKPALLFSLRLLTATDLAEE